MTRGQDPARASDGASRWTRSRAALDDHDQRRTSGRTVVDVRPGDDRRSNPTRCSTPARAATGLDDFGPDGFREGLEALLRVARARGAAQRPRRRWRSRAAGRVAWRTGCGSSTGSQRTPRSPTSAIDAPIVVDRHVPCRHDAPQPPVRPGPSEPRAAACGRRATACRRRRRPTTGRARGSTRSTPATRCSREINPQIEVVHHEQADEATECIAVMGAGLQEPDLGGDRQRPVVRRAGCSASTSAPRTSTTGRCCRCSRAGACAGGGR